MLQLHTLLNLQRTFQDPPQRDELLFIIIHQVYELWFKEMLHELDYLCRRLDEDQLTGALDTFKRILTILKVLVSQIDVLETMTPIDYLTFREMLGPASGFQSYAYRKLEVLLGNKMCFIADGGVL